MPTMDKAVRKIEYGQKSFGDSINLTRRVTQDAGQQE